MMQITTWETSETSKGMRAGAARSRLFLFLRKLFTLDYIRVITQFFWTQIVNIGRQNEKFPAIELGHDLFEPKFIVFSHLCHAYCVWIFLAMLSFFSLASRAQQPARLQECSPPFRRRFIYVPFIKNSSRFCICSTNIACPQYFNHSLIPTPQPRPA